MQEKLDMKPSSKTSFSSSLADIESANRHIWLPVALTLTLVAAILCSWWAVTKTEKQLRSNLISTTKLVAEAVKIDHVLALTGQESDLNRPEYKRIKQQLSITQAQIPRCRFLYLFGKKADGSVFFFVDSEPSGSEFYSHPGQHYDEASMLLKSVFKTKTEAIEGPLPDRWGIWVSGLVPLVDPASDDVVAVLGMDIDAKEWNGLLIRSTFLPVSFALLLIVVFIVGAILFAFRRRFMLKGIRRYKHIESWLTVIVGLVITLFIAHSMHQSESSAYNEIFRQYADTKTAIVANSLRTLQDVELEGLARYFEASDYVDAAEFSIFATHLTKNPTVQAWEWVPEVKHQDKGRFEAVTRAEGLMGFEIWERDENGNRRPVPVRDVYYPVQRVLPIKGNEQILGFDAGSEPIRFEVLQKAKMTSLVTCSEPLELMQNSNINKALIIFRPVFHQARDGSFVGFAVAVLQVNDVLQFARPSSTVALSLTMGMSKDSPQILAISEHVTASLAHLSFMRPVFAFGRVFLITAHAGPNFSRLHPPRTGLLTMLIGLVFTLAVASAIRITISRREELEQLVADKTRSLRQSEEKLSATLRSIGDGVISCDHEGHVIRLNPVAEKLTGWSNQEALGKKVDEVFALTATNHSTAESPVYLAITHGETAVSESNSIITARDGEKRQLSISYAPIRDQADSIIGAVLVFRDVTDEHRQRAELAEERRRLEYILGVTKTGINISDEEFNLQFVDREWQKVYGDPTGKKCYEYFMGTHEPCPSCPIPYVFESKKTVIAEQVLPAENNRIVEVHSIPFQDDKGRWLVAEFNVDITERKNAEAEREKLLAAIEQAGEIFIVTDTAGIIQYVNPAFERVTQYDRTEVYGKTPSLWKSGQQSEQFYKEQWDTISMGKTWQGRLINKRKDGSFYTSETTISPVFDKTGSIVSFIAVMRDITEHLRLAAQYQQSQKMESVGRLAGGVAHDFNNMLGVILGRAELLLSKVSGVSQLEYHVKEIQKAANRSAELTRQLLAYARKQTINPIVLDLNSTIANMLTMLQRIIGEDIELTWKPNTNLWPVKMDPSQIDQILVNLVVNSRDAISQNGKITIETSTFTVDHEYCINHTDAVLGDYVMLAVSDNGCGMDAETKKRLFEPFFTTKEVGKGTGLGLATIYGIVKQNSGFINVYSEVGMGTTFRLYLPRAESKKMVSEIESYSYVPRGNGETVLLVEDESSMLNLTHAMLMDLGYNALKANSPEEAIQLANDAEHTIDLLLTDVVMPKINGRELANALKVHHPSMKCVFMSGYTANVIAHHGVLDQNIHFIQKPFSQKDLAVLLRSLLDGQNLDDVKQ